MADGDSGSGFLQSHKPRGPIMAMRVCPNSLINQVAVHLSFHVEEQFYSETLWCDVTTRNITIPKLYYVYLYISINIHKKRDL